ncbi:MAG: RAD55 family ATPase [Candidatus Heimdallarchaeaceae archaeon]|jgi:KaiC/GvpD/RAD55 family RecA-like ATPase
MSVKTSIDILVHQVTSSLILMVGESGTAKEEMAFRFIEDGLNKGESVLAVLFAHSTFDYIEELKKRELDVDKLLEKGQLNFIDAMSFRATPKEKPPNTIFLENANDLLILSININDISLKSSKLRIVFDQLSLITLYNTPMHVLNFLQSLAARIRQREQCALLLLDTGVIEEHIENTLHTIVDILVEAKRTDEPSGIQQLVRIKFAKHKYEPRWVQVV